MFLKRAEGFSFNGWLRGSQLKGKHLTRLDVLLLALSTSSTVLGAVQIHCKSPCSEDFTRQTPGERETKK